MAQDPVYIANERGSQLIDSTMAMMNIRAERFNEEIGKVNALKALEVASLEKNIIPKNVQKIKDFLAYLDLYRSLSEQLMQATRDSVEKFKELLPSRERPKFLKDFLDAYEMDQKSFDKYTLALTKVFSQVIDAISFIEKADVKIEGKKIFFTKKSESDEYNDIIEEIGKSQRKLVTASANSQKARIDAGSIMQKAYGRVTK